MAQQSDCMHCGIIKHHTSLGNHQPVTRDQPPTVTRTDGKISHKLGSNCLSRPTTEADK